MWTIWRNVALGVVTTLALGCNSGVTGAVADGESERIAGATKTTGANAYAQGAEVRVVDLPDVGGCERLYLATGFLTLHPVSGMGDLYLVRSSGQPACIDTLRGIVSSTPGRTLEDAASDPMPGDPGVNPTASDPMPGDPGVTPPTAASDPMPGTSTKK